MRLPRPLSLATLLMLAVSASTPAIAGTKLFIGFGHGHGHGHYHGHYSHRYHRPRNSLKSPLRYYRYDTGHGYHHGSARSCHPVHKWVTDHYGRQSQIGGTMCYDAYGNGYVVPGSRYVIGSAY